MYVSVELINEERRYQRFTGGGSIDPFSMNTTTTHSNTTTTTTTTTTTNTYSYKGLNTLQLLQILKCSTTVASCRVKKISPYSTIVH